MRKIALIAVLALAGLPAGALAARGSHPTTPAGTNANSNASGSPTVTRSSSASSNANTNAGKVLFLIHGTVTAYTANVSISITFKSSNFESSALKGATQPLTFVLNSKTKVILHNGDAIKSGDKAIVKVRAAKNATVSTLETTPAFQVVDQGSSS